MTIYIKNKEVKYFKFPGGEISVNIFPAFNPRNDNVTIKAFLSSSDDILALLLTVDAIRKVSHGAALELVIPYIPYARQDRVCNFGESFSLGVICELIKSMKFNSIITYDSHSDVFMNIIGDVKHFICVELIKKSILDSFMKEKNIVLVCPDEGAKHRTFRCSLYYNKKIIYCSKQRDLSAGTIIGLDIDYNGNEKNKNFLIVDDICDGGRTFIEISKQLKENGAKEIYLYVTHGIFSNGFCELKKYINHIYCAYPFRKTDEPTDFLTYLYTQEEL